MPGIKLYTGNKLEDLLQELFKILSTPLSSSLKTETIIVQSKGMERWICMQTAIHFGIQANTEFPFPNSVINNIFNKLLGHSTDKSLFRPDLLTWRIMDILPGLINNPLFFNIKNYLSIEPSDNPEELADYTDLKLYQLSSLIADTFDQYLFYRPELIFSWEKNNLKNTPESEYWQAVLWQNINSEEIRKDYRHRAELRSELLEKLYNSPPLLSALPERISVFGISVLPPFHMEIFNALAGHIDIYFFLMNPCREFWSYISSEKVISSEKNREGELFENLYFERGNKLLSSLGLMGREFFSFFYDLGFDDLPGFIKHDLFSSGNNNTILNIIQSDILNLIDRKKYGKCEITEIDNSIQIHSCHSPIREVEVLYDQIINILDNDKSVNQEDILVMIPDIDTYVPYIESVFSSTGSNIVYNISDRKVLLESIIINTFFHILNIGELRFSVNSVLKLLEVNAVTDKFGFSADDISLIKNWIIKLNIRWGFNENSKTEIGLPPVKENTWQDGINRLLLGYSMKTEKLFDNILPFSEIELSKSDLLNNFIKFIYILSDISKSIGKSDTLSGWSEKFLQIIEVIFKSDKNYENEINLLSDTVLSLKETEYITGFNKKIFLNTAVQFLKSKLNTKSVSFSFLSGGITFCAMLPMRSIPFKVICLLGMNNNSFPGKNVKINFDLISIYPKAGDRSRRNDDRYLFLETILSARKILYLSYTGQNANDNTELQPSVLLSELSDTITESFKFKDTDDIAKLITTRHKLQAFNKEYFSRGSRYFSYSKENYNACINSLKRKNNNSILLSHNLPAEDNMSVIELDSLCNFFNNPCKYLLNNRFNIYLEKPDKYFSDKEDFILSELDKYLLSEELIGLALSGEELKNYYSIVKSKSILPPGYTGKIIYSDILNEVLTFVKDISKYSENQYVNTIDLNINGTKLIGNTNLEKNFKFQFLYRYTKTKFRDRIKLWIYHLASCTYLDNINHPDKKLFKSLFFSKNNKIELKYLDNSYEMLEAILKYYNSGLLNTLFFFPETSIKFASILFKINPFKSEILKQKDNIENALDKVHNIWEGNIHRQGEKDNLYYKYFFNEGNPLNMLFVNTTINILYPLLAFENISSINF